ncbi:MAG: hypothetical protein IPJ88_17100 [Myxococcales bacterium]|nr:MAG: hypothetical protein IPJ88_17100 [Myxococcales bacterium]
MFRFLGIFPNLAILSLCLAAGCGQVEFGNTNDAGDTGPDPDASIGNDSGNQSDSGTDSGTNSCTGLTCGFIPSNGIAAVLPNDTSSLGDTVVGANGSAYWEIDTDTGAIEGYDDLDRNGNQQIRAGLNAVSAGIFYALLPKTTSPNIGVFVSRSLTIPNGTFVFGKGNAALAWITIEDDITIEGWLSVRADTFKTSRPGPGGAQGGQGGGAAGQGIGGGGGGTAGGGGGGGFGSVGGLANDGAAGTAGGIIYGSAELSPLVAGSGGGSGPGSTGAVGGNGGGALQLFSFTAIELGLSGRIDAGGGGGATPDDCCNLGNGGGGGSGGAILLEAPTVLIAGLLGANGGGGGQGGENSAQIPGTPGSPTVVPAPGSVTSSSNGGGGNGSDAQGVAGEGLAAFTSGGGGGGAGRVRINTASGAESFGPGITPSVLSGLSTIGTLATE